RPQSLDHHRFDGEIGVFLAAEVQIGHDARDHEDDHEIPDDRAVIERHCGKIELGLSVLIAVPRRIAHRGASSGIFTDCPGMSECTPAVTTRSPGSSPAFKMAFLLSRLRIATSRGETVLAAGSTTQTCCFPSCSKSAAAGIFISPPVCAAA